MGPVLELRARRAGWIPTPAVVRILVTAVVVATSGVATVVARTTGGQAPAPLIQAAPAVGGAASGVPAIPPGADPLRIRIPAIGVEAPVVPLGLDADGRLQVPRYQEAGWYTGGSRPGETGPAVIAAHVDSTTGPAVFYRLDDLAPGDEVFVDYRDDTVGFVVRDARRVTKTQFPTQQVYGATTAPELRLVTCAGDFHRRTRTYTANLIVWADLLEAA